MDSLSSKHPLLILKELEQTFTSSDSGLSANASNNSVWAGLAVQLGKIDCIIETKYVSEILLSECLEDMSTVPGVKPWLKGLISWQGRALPIVDLGLFIHGHATPINNKARVLVINFGEFSNGILVSKTLGLKRIGLSATQITAADHVNSIKYLNNTIVINNQQWPILDVVKLANDSEFRSMAGN